MKTPADLMGILDGHVERLDGLGKELDSAVDTLGEAEEIWNERYDEYVAAEIEDCANSTRRIPGDTKLLSLARQSYRVEWNDFQRAKREVDKLTREQSRIKSQITGIQSELATLRTESGAPPSRREGPTFGKRAA